jgi:Family of unknown function (DUF5895)
MTTNPENKYLSRQYAATDFSFPYVQGLRGENPQRYGYFVPLSQANKAGWRDLDPTKLTEYAYNNGKTEVGLLLQQPRMVLTPVSSLGMFDRKASLEEETLVVLGKWDRQYRDDENVGNFQIYLVMFFDEHKQPLHDLPLKLVAKGAQQATLSEQWQQFCVAVARCQAQAHKVFFSPRNEVFNALCLFQPHLIRKSVGEKTKSPALYVDGYVEPTVANWQDFFLGTDADLSDMVVGLMNPRSRLLLADPTPGAIALTPAAEAQPQIEAQPVQPTAVQQPAVPTPAIDVKSSTMVADKWDGNTSGIQMIEERVRSSSTDSGNLDLNSL